MEAKEQKVRFGVAIFRLRCRYTRDPSLRLNCGSRRDDAANGSRGVANPSVASNSPGDLQEQESE